MTSKVDKSSEKIRSEVSEAYARAVRAPSGCGCCCGGNARASSPGVGPDPRGVIAQAAGYDPNELATLPPDAVASSFGCGNPLAYAKVRRGEVVLDLGSGAGIDLLIAAERVGPEGRVIGVDMTDEMNARARDNAALAGHANVEVRRGIIEDLPVEDSSVDWVISNCVINLSPEKGRVFAEIARVLRPGGHISVSDIVASDLPSSLRESAALHSACVGGAISEEEYKAGLEAAGLEDVDVIDRLVYERSQIAALVESEEVPGTEAALFKEKIEQLAAEVEGKVWSARFAGRKPE